MNLSSELNQSREELRLFGHQGLSRILTYDHIHYIVLVDTTSYFFLCPFFGALYRSVLDQYLTCVTSFGVKKKLIYSCLKKKTVSH